MSEYYVPLNELPKYCRDCPCSEENTIHSMDDFSEVATCIWCRITGDIVAQLPICALDPNWNAVPRPDNCPIVHWVYISVGDCDDTARS